MKYPRAIQETLDTVLPIIKKAGATYNFQTTGKAKHAKLHITYNGQTRMTPIAGSPSCLFDTLNLKKRDVRRILRELGAENA